MKAFGKWVALICILPVFFLAFGCSGGGGGGSATTPNLSLKLTDNPGDYLNVFVTFTGIYAIIEDYEPLPLTFADFDSPAVVEETPDSFTVDLLQLANGNAIEIALGDLPEGQLNQLRLIVTAAELYAYEDVVQRDGPDDGDDITHVVAEFDVKVPSGPQTGIKLNPRDVYIQSGALTSLTLDFDADKSIVKLGPPHKPKKKKKDYDFILKPVIFILGASGAIPVDTETVALNLDFPTGLEVTNDVGSGSIIPDGNVLVCNAGTSNTLLDLDAVGAFGSATPIDATTVTPFASIADTDGGGEAYVNSPSGVTQHMDLVWIANAASIVAAGNAGTVTEIYTDGTLNTIYIDNDPPTDSVEGLITTSGIEFGGFAPDGSLTGYEWLVFQTNGNGSVTGLNIKDTLLFDVLVASSFSAPSDAVFIPGAVSVGDAEGATIGWLYVTDAGANEVVMLKLTATGGAIGDAATGIAVAQEAVFTPSFISEPVGIAYSDMTGRLYIANRGNGTVSAIGLDGTEIETYDTGLGADAINGIDVYTGGAADLVFFTNTAANTLEGFEAL
jgi:hypothetical protein